MTRVAKKDRELRFVGAWREVEPSCPDGELAASECPDFLLPAQKGTIGIEVTEMLVPTTEQFPPIAREYYQDQAVLLAQRLHRASGGPPLDVAVLFGQGTPVTKQTVQSVARNIVAVVEANTPLHGRREWKNEGLENVELWIIRVFRSAAYLERTWHTWQTGMVPMGESSWIQRRIDEKASRNYSLPISNVWIVIVSESLRASSVALFDDDVLLSEYKSPFGRVFLFDSTRIRSIELRVRP